MKIVFIEKHVSVSDAIKEYAEKKASKLNKYFQKETTAQATFAKEGDKHKVELTVSNEGLIYRSNAVSDDLYAGVDAVVSHIERQIHKHKTRLEKRLRQGAFEREIPAINIVPDVEEETDFPIIRTKHFEFKPMTPEEAILQMNLLQHEFFVFKNFSQKGQMSVVYKRRDGGYGLIEEG